MFAHPVRAQNLVTNGGFEAGTFPNADGWTIVSPGGDTYVYASAPRSGIRSASLGEVGTTGSISQTISGLLPGRNYTLNFWLSAGGGTPNSFVASFAGTQLLSITNTSGFAYTKYTYTVTATGTSAALLFEGQHDPAFYRLDDVELYFINPSAADTQTSLQDLADQLRGVYRLQNALVTNGHQKIGRAHV